MHVFCNNNIALSAIIDHSKIIHIIHLLYVAFLHSLSLSLPQYIIYYPKRIYKIKLLGLSAH
ncbi:hypothetical protein Ahy_A07g031078 isoform B [Arachis hypogaea]|uniref:Uncharacterized protein n=1 Tax=Arachis hypogaea TaxID=3818 RepID=A0A445C2R7_ARAHY|nr:hypothetical protein Ahy_A07g031078 isoform B [Arachis hypogaea]